MTQGTYVLIPQQVAEDLERLLETLPLAQGKAMYDALVESRRNQNQLVEAMRTQTLQRFGALQGPAAPPKAPPAPPPNGETPNRLPPMSRQERRELARQEAKRALQDAQAEEPAE